MNVLMNFEITVIRELLIAVDTTMRLQAHMYHHVGIQLGLRTEMIQLHRYR